MGCSTSVCRTFEPDKVSIPGMKRTLSEAMSSVNCTNGGNLTKRLKVSTSGAWRICGVDQVMKIKCGESMKQMQLVTDDLVIVPIEQEKVGLLTSGGTPGGDTLMSSTTAGGTFYDEILQLLTDLVSIPENATSICLFLDPQDILSLGQLNYSLGEIVKRPAAWKREWDYFDGDLIAEFMQLSKEGYPVECATRLGGSNGLLNNPEFTRSFVNTLTAWPHLREIQYNVNNYNDDNIYALAAFLRILAGTYSSLTLCLMGAGDDFLKRLAASANFDWSRWTVMLDDTNATNSTLPVRAVRTYEHEQLVEGNSKVGVLTVSPQTKKVERCFHFTKDDNPEVFLSEAKQHVTEKSVINGLSRLDLTSLSAHHQNGQLPENFQPFGNTVGLDLYGGGYVVAVFERSTNMLTKGC